MWLHMCNYQQKLNDVQSSINTGFALSTAFVVEFFMIATFTYYMSIVQEFKFFKHFMEMANY